jgi:hypothetical protein
MKQTEIHEIEYLGCRFRAEDFETLMLLEPKNVNIQYFLERNCIKFADGTASEELKQEAANSLRYLCAKDSIKVMDASICNGEWEASLEELVECMKCELKNELWTGNAPVTRWVGNTVVPAEFDHWWQAVTKVFGKDRLEDGALNALLVRKLEAILGLIWENNIIKETTSKTEPITITIHGYEDPLRKEGSKKFTINITPFVNGEQAKQKCGQSTDEDHDTWRRKLLGIMGDNWVGNIEHITWQDVNSVKDLVDWEEKYRWSNSRMCYNCCDCYASDDEITKTQKMASSHVNRCWRCTALCSPNILEDESGEDTDLVIRNTVWTQFMHDGQKLTTNWNKENVPAVAADSVV